MVDISGFTIARNVIKYSYPIRESLLTLRPICSEVIVGYDPYTDDGTDEFLTSLAEDLDLTLFESKWDMSNFQGGTELGIQTDLTMAQCAAEWQLYLQLDEGFHEKDVEIIKFLPETVASDVTGIDFYRLYFYGALTTIRKDWCALITRLTRKDTHTYARGDAMSCVPLVGRHQDSDVYIYHYSRIGNPEVISQRVRNLDGFYHLPDTLLDPKDVPAYDFKTRKWDNYSKIETPPEVGEELYLWTEGHPRVFSGS